MKIKRLMSAAIAAILFTTVCWGDAIGSPGDVIPRPQSVSPAQGTFRLADAPTYYIKGVSDETLGKYMEESPLKLIPATRQKSADVVVDIKGDKGEGYVMKITPKRIAISADGPAGAFYGIQTLLQLTADGKVREMQCCEISDSPRFPYRGLHFDVSRNFRSKEFLKKQIDAMAMLKMNNMHLHLTDGAGWRLQIDAYPRLTDFAAWRPQKSWMDWRDAGTKYCERTDPHAQGGYYTKDDIREIVDYAAARHIRVIPEIEMPGHSEEVLAAYPELSCTGTPYTSSDFCAGKEATFKFLENVLAEVIELFPSEYIHIGGDEASKDAWRKCPDCRERMEREGLKDVDGLQSYFIKRIERFVNSKGRKIIGWDEILDGGVAPNATVMSWRGTEGGIKALKSGHDVVMTPGEYCYIDYSQDAPFKEPVSIGGYTPLAKVYSYEPVEAGLSDGDVAHLLGVQANLWSEYVADDSHAEHMYYPRAYAVAEVGWSSPEKDYDDFHRRALKLNEEMAGKGYTPFDLAHEYGERRESLTPVAHAGRGAKVAYGTPYNSKYPAAGYATLTDGVRGGWTYGDKRWQGFSGDMDVTLDLGEVKPVHYVGADFMHSEGAWVHLPECVTISVSTDGTTFTDVDTVWCDVDATYPKILFKEYGTAVDTEARYVRVRAKANPRPGAWLFTDEIVVN